MGKSTNSLAVFKTYIPKNAQKRFLEVMASGWVGCGKETDLFEKEFGKKFGVPYTVATNSCTSALHLAYVLAGIKPGDEVIATVFTCTASNIPILYTGAKIVFADVQRLTMNIDPDDIERKITKKTKAIVLVHWGGYPADMDRITAIAKKHKLKVIVDAAHALGAKYNGKSIAQYGDFCCYSFQAIKQITTIEGGMLVVRKKDEYERAKLLRWYGLDRLADRDTPKRYEEFRDLGFRYIPNDVFMAMGRIQLKENLDKVIAHRRSLVRHYEDTLAGLPFITFLDSESKKYISGHWLFTILIEKREQVRKLLAKHGIATSLAHFRNDISPVLSYKKWKLPNMDAIEDKYLCLPLHMDMTKKDIDRIADILWYEYKY